MCSDSSRLVRLHEVFETRSEIALVLELAAGGELQRVLDDEECLAERQARHVMRQILEGLSHLHARNLAHLDLKPQNLLLTADFPEGEVKLCDFGISRLIESDVEVREILGTPDYVAPEILAYNPISLATDIWSVGVLAYVLLSGYSPFAGDTKQETFLNISQCSLTFPSDLFEDVSDTAFDFIKAALIVDPKKRMTVQECLDHPWINDTAKLSTPHSMSSLLTPPQEKYEGFLRVVLPETDKLFDVKDSIDKIDEGSSLLLKHSHHKDKSPPFPDAPSTPKVSRKSHPDSPPTMLNHCKLYQMDKNSIFSPDKILGCKNRADSCDGVFTSGKVVLEVAKFESKIHTKENHPLTAKNGTNGVGYDSDVIKVSADSSYPQCECCNLMSSHNKHTTSNINHVDRAILC
ncbi:death-associated protein kinase related isoform X2 [Arctopsyche grandis]